jgi:adenylate cyclase
VSLYFLALIGFPLGVTLLAFLRVSRSGSAEGVVLPMAIFIGGSFLVGMLLTLLLTRAIQGPLAAMAGTARQVGGGNYDVAAPVSTNDEIGELGHAMNEMIGGLAERERLRDAFGRAVTPEVRDYLVERGATLGGRELTVSMLFLDVRGFTTLSEGLAPEETLSWLNTVFAVVGEAIFAAGGTIDKYMGDAVMAVFGAPMPQEDHAQRALNAARQIRMEASALAVEPPLRYGIGLHSGPVLAGTMGTKRRMDFTVIGDTVNTASRVEAMCKDLDREVLMTGEFVAQLGTSAGELIDLGDHHLRGRNRPVRLYTPA